MFSKKSTFGNPLLLLVVLWAFLLSACAGLHTNQAEKALPAPTVDDTSMFMVDANINMKTIDEWLGRDDVAYRDVRMLFDPAAYGEIGGDADLSATLEGFKIIPYPYVATLQSLPVEGAYSGKHLFDVIWDENGKVSSALPVFEESLMILSDIFPRDKAIFLMCGGGGYAGMMKELLLYLGYDPSKLYNIGGQWEYQGSHTLEIKHYPEDKEDAAIFKTWNADYTYFDFDKMSPVSDKTLETYLSSLGKEGTDDYKESGAVSSSGEKQGDEDKVVTEMAGAAFPVFTFSHYSSGGTREDYQAVILFEQANQSFTAYQVAFPSCTCRDPIVNYYSVCYVELLNSRRNAEDAAIRDISFRNNQGLYGDSNPNYYIAEYTEEYMHENFIDQLIGVTKADFDDFTGYGSWVEAIDVDAIAGATVTTSNVQSLLKSLFEYHTDKYYQSL